MPDGDGSARAVALRRIGRAIQQHRGELSQEGLAKKAGVSLNTVAFLERGQKMPWPVNRDKIETALGWPAGTLTAMYKDGAPAPSLPREEGTTTPLQGLRPLPPAGRGRQNAAIVNIALDATRLAAACGRILRRHAGGDPEAAAAITELDRQTQVLEATIAASLPTADSDSLFDQMVAVLAELRRNREDMRNASRD